MTASRAYWISARAILGLYNAICLLVFRNSIRKAYGAATANWYGIFQACQFHVMFYASRTLPNFIPFGLSTVAVGLLIEKTISKSKPHTTVEPSLLILTILGIVFRSELAIFLGTHTVYWFLKGHLTIPAIVLSGAVGLGYGLLLTVPVDSFLWQQYPLWPELTSFLFNIYEGRSIDWGVSPWYYYITNAMPKILFNPLIFGLCIPFTLLNSSLRGSAVDLLTSNLAYIAIYSFQPHKEWRFIVYAIPAMTAAGAQGAAWIWNRRAKSAVYAFVSSALVLSCLTSLAASLMFLSISTLNYPGAAALDALQMLADGTKPSINVHMDVLTAQTGATLFLQLPSTVGFHNSSAWNFDKTDDKTGDGTLLRRPEFWAKFDYALAEKPEKCIGAWEELAVVEGFAGIGIVRPFHDDPSPLRKSSGSSRSTERASFWGKAPWSPFTSHIWRLWKYIGAFMRRNITRGWWIDAKMQPMIRILQRIPQDEVRESILKQ